MNRVPNLSQNLDLERAMAAPSGMPSTRATAMELKNALPCDVLVMGLVGEAEFDEAIARGVILAVFSLEYARDVYKRQSMKCP